MEYQLIKTCWNKTKASKFPPVYSLRGIHAYNELKIFITKVGRQDRRLQSASKGISFGLNLWQEGLPREMSQQQNKFKTQAYLEKSPCLLFLATRYWCVLLGSAYTTTRVTELHFCKTAVGNNEFTFVLMSVCKMYEYETRKVLMPLTKCRYTV
jgi:hypothetical protein